MRPALPLLLLLLLPVFAHAQSGPVDEQNDRLLFTTQHYGMDAGLPHRAVTALAQDDRGFLWIGTPQGIARFDGYRFQVRPRFDGHSNNNVQQLNIDSEGMLWVMYLDGRIEVVDPRTGVVKPFAVHFSGRLPPEAVGPFNNMVLSPDGDLLFTRNGYLLRFRGDPGSFDVKQVECEHRLAVSLVTRTNEAWCACQKEEEYWTKNDLLCIPFPVVQQGGAAKKSFRKGSFRIPPQLHDRSGWHPSEDPGVYFLGSGALIWAPTGELPVDKMTNWLPALGNKGSSFLFMPLTDGAWLVNGTVRRMRAGDNPFTAPVLFNLASLDPDIPSGLISAFRDRAGNVWIGSEFGLYKINIQPAYFQNLLQGTAERSTTNYRIRGMVMTNGRLHVNTERQGYWVLDATTGAVISTEANDNLRRAMVGDGRGGLWRLNGVDALHENAKGKVDRTVRAAKGSHPPWSMLELKNGSLLIGTVQSGLRMAEVHDASSRVFPSGHVSLDNAWVWHIMYDPAGNLLACTNAGLFRLDEHGQVLERWWSGAMQQKDTAHYLPADDIRYCHVDPQGIYWLATASNGLLRWDRKTGEVRILGKREGIPEASIHAILSDAEGMLWMPTDNGLVRYDPVSATTRVFTTNDGLPSNEFNRLAYAQGPDGRFYFGGLNGIAAFHPKDLRSAPRSPMAPLVIGEVHKQLAMNQGLEDLTARVLEGGAITMQPSDRYFTVDMSLLSYEDPARIRYAWRIEGIDEAWTEQSEPHLRINTLPYGDHLLQIKAMDAKGRWTEALLNIPITMITPLHLRWWSILGAVLLVALAIYQLVSYRERQLRKLITMRELIASDLHDEVGSTLSSIVLFSSAVGKQTNGLSPDARNMLTRIKANSTRAMESMNDIVWSVNTDHDTLEDLVDRMRTYAQPLCDTMGIELVLDQDQGMQLQKLGMEQRKNIYLIFKEAVNNAVKHAHCTRIIIQLRQIGSYLELRVMDNGTGFILTELDKDNLGGNGLGNMGRRAADIGGTLEVAPLAEGGTQVRLQAAMGEV